MNMTRFLTAEELQCRAPQRTLEDLDLVYDADVYNKFYLVTTFRSSKWGEGTIQLEVEDGAPKMFRVATAKGSGNYCKSLRDALIVCMELGYKVRNINTLMLFDRLDKQVQGYWQSHD